MEEDLLAEIKIDLLSVDHLLHERGGQATTPIVTRGKAARTGMVQGAILNAFMRGVTRGRGVSIQPLQTQRASVPRREAFRPSKIDDPNERYRKFREITDRDFREQFLSGNQIDRKNFMRNFSSRIGSYQVDRVSRSSNPQAAMRKLLDDLKPQSNNLEVPATIPNRLIFRSSSNIMDTLRHRENL